MSAVTLETLTARVDVRPYTGLTAIQRQQSGIARAQVSLIWDQTTLAATSAGNFKGLVMEGELPRNFAYVYSGGSISIGRVAQADVEDVSRGVYFENIINCAINTFQNEQADSFVMSPANVTAIDLDGNRQNSAGNVNYVTPSTSSSLASTRTAVSTPGTYDPYSDLYKKIYNDVSPPRIIYRGEESDVTVRARVANLVEDPFPAAQYVALGVMHFLQYDIDQAYNYLIHSPIPVR